MRLVAVTVRKLLGGAPVSPASGHAMCCGRRSVGRHAAVGFCEADFSQANVLHQWLIVDGCQCL